MIHFFLEKADIRKLELLRYLENSTSYQASREVIIKDLDVTEFLLNKMIEEINLDFEKYDLVNNFKLEASNLVVKLLKNKKCASNQLEICLVKDSLTFSLIVALFFEEFISINHYAENNFLSYSTVYNKLSDIRAFISKFGFTVIKNNKIKGNESNIRLFFSYIFFKVYNQSLLVYSNDTKDKSLDL
ncbi:MAG: helix-turn-helix domain-containing protein, partial [Vagococcus fluvialis]